MSEDLDFQELSEEDKVLSMPNPRKHQLYVIWKGMRGFES